MGQGSRRSGTGAGRKAEKGKFVPSTRGERSAEIGHTELACSSVPGRRLPMPRSLAFLRGINLGKRRVTMRVLMDAVTALGFTEVSTHLASGNVVFTHARASTRSLEARFEKGLEEALGYPVDTHVRSEDDVRDLCLQAPVAEGPAALAQGSLYVAFFKDELTADQRRGLARASSSTDAFTPRVRETYWRSAIPFHESKA